MNEDNSKRYLHSALNHYLGNIPLCATTYESTGELNVEWLIENKDFGVPLLEQAVCDEGVLESGKVTRDSIRDVLEIVKGDILDLKVFKEFCLKYFEITNEKVPDYIKKL